MKLLKSMFGVSILTATFLSPLMANAADKIVVYGASGKIGSIIVDEAVDRGYEVVGVTRNPDKNDLDREGFSVVKGDVTSAESIQEIVSGAKAVIISVSGGGDSPETSMTPRAAAAAIEALTDMDNAPYLIQVNGSSTIGSTPEQLEKQWPPFTANKPKLKNAMRGQFLVLDYYRASNIDWSAISPAKSIKGWSPMGLVDGETSMGSYQTSTETLVRNSEGNSEIWVRDLAKAIIDEVEGKSFVQQHFTVGYQ